MGVEMGNGIDMEVASPTLRSGRESIPSEAMEAVEAAGWAKKNTYNGSVEREGIHAIFKKRSIAIVGDDAETGKKELVLVTPQFSVNNWDEVAKVQKEANWKYHHEVGNAVKVGLLTSERAEEILMERPDALVKFQGLDKFSKKGRPSEFSQPEIGSSTGSSHVAPLVENISGKRFLSKSTRILAVGGISFVAASCSVVPEIAPIQLFTKTGVAAVTATPTESSATSTSEPTSTTEPSPTPDMRFSELVPETPELCKQNNKIRPGHETEDLATILAMEEKLNIDFSKVPELSIGIPNYDSKILKLPSVIGLTFNNKNGKEIIISSCAYEDLGNGNGLFQLGIPLRRTGSSQGGFFHFAMEPELVEKYFGMIGYPQAYKYNDIENYYPSFAQEHKKITMGGVNLILSRGYAEQGGIWDNLLNLLPKDKNDWEWKSAAFLSNGCAINPAKGVMECVASQEDLVKYMEEKIIPAVSIGVIY